MSSLVVVSATMYSLKSLKFILKFLNLSYFSVSVFKIVKTYEDNLIHSSICFINTILALFISVLLGKLFLMYILRVLILIINSSVGL